MVNNTQQWLNQHYPNKQETTQIIAKNQNLEGKIIIEDYPNLERIEIGGNKNLTSIEINNLPKLNYFHANNCTLTELNIINCPEVNYFNVGNNLLRESDFLNNLNPEKLTVLSIHTNNFKKQSLNVFSQFSNLKELYLDNCDREKFRKHIFNRFFGSLKSLQNLSKLELLSIGNTEINSGLEYLPSNLRKIGFNVAWQTKTGCFRIKQELEKASKIEGVTEELQKHEEVDPVWIDSYYRTAPWRQAQYLSEKERQRKMLFQIEIQKELEKYPEDVTYLNLSGKKLEGSLDLRRFIKLEKLDCSRNQLTSLDLSKCSNLTHLYCEDNLLENLDFLSFDDSKGLPNPEKLKDLYMGDNEKIPSQNLGFLIPFTNLEHLSLDNCPFEGTLEYLKDMKNLQSLSISRTNIDSGLEDLPMSCRTLYCDYDYQSNKKTLNIIKRMNKFFTNGGYDLTKWREDKQDQAVASSIPLERLFIIRSNIKKFADKWGVGEESSNESEKNSKLRKYLFWPYDKINELLKGEEQNLSELSKLTHPDEFSKQWWLIKGVQWANRAASVAGGSLVFVGQSDTENPNSQLYTQVGGVIAIASPFVETLTSYINDQVYEAKQAKWDEFVEDTKSLLDNYHELLGILEKIEISKFGEINRALKKLDETTDLFLADYDDDNNGVIDISELLKKENRERLVNDLSDKENSKLINIVDSIKNLEGEIIRYRQGIVDKESYESKSKLKRQLAKEQRSVENNSKENIEVLVETNQERLDNLESEQLVESQIMELGPLNQKK